MRINFRQGIVRHQTDGSNNPLFLNKVGQDVTLLVSPDFTIISFIHGNKDYLFTEAVTVSNAWASLPAGVDSWLYWDLNKVTGVRTFGFTEFVPINQAAAPTSPVVGQMWFNPGANMWFEYNGASWVEKIRLFAAKLELGTTLKSMSANAPLFTGTQIGNTSTVNVGSLAFDAVGNPIINQGGTFFTTEDVFTAGVPTGASLKVNNILVRAIAQEPIAAYQVVNFSDYDEIILASPFDAVSTVYGIVDSPVPTGDIANVITDGVIFNPAWDWDLAGGVVNDPVYIDATGQVVLVADIPNQVPVGAIIGKQEILFQLGIFGYGGSTSLSDHGALLGLAADDHPQYHNDARGDARYATLAQGALADTALQSLALESIKNLLDVNTAMVPVEDQVLAWDNTAGEWIARNRLDNDAAAIWGNITGTLSNQSDLNTALGLKEDAFVKNSGFNKDFGSIAGTVCEGNDSRLSDARTPLGHSHVAADVTDFSNAADARIAAASINDLANVFATMTPADGEVLTYDFGNTRWDSTAITSKPSYEKLIATGGQTIFSTTVDTIATTTVASLQVFRNGSLQNEGGGDDFTVSGANEITFNAGLTLGDVVILYTFV